MGIVDRFRDPEADETMVVLVTAPTAEKAAEIARTVVEEKLAACGSVIPGIRSIYRWQGKVCDEAEALLVLKAPKKRLVELSDRIVKIHPYEVPEVVALPIEGGNWKYIDWIVQSMY
ncbi:MAG TPA: divalent-cation tolerance protein CutA [Anaeromyxobacteraceae bacterium]|nr:divalent-cation tolerance protein CutA [Anaeromyxobacteraceae bacterium]